MTDIQWNGHLVIMAPLFWPKQKLSQSFCYLKNPFDMATLLTWPDFCGLLVTGLMGLHCIYMYNFSSNFAHF